MTQSLPNTTLLAILGAGLALIVVLLAVGKVPLGYNVRNLLARWKTTAVTALAFTVVIGLLTFMLAFVNGMYRLTENSGVPGNVIVLSDGATDEAFSNLPGGISASLMPQGLQAVVLKNDKGDFLGTKEVFVILSQQLKDPDTGAVVKRRFVQMRGLHDPYIAAAVHDIELKEGRWFSKTGVDEKTGEFYEVVLGEGIAGTFGADLGLDGPVPLGTVLDIGQKKWQVVGIMKSGSTAFGSEVWALDTKVGDNFGRRNSYTCGVLRTKNAATARELAAGLKAWKTDVALLAQPEPEYYAKLNETNQQFLVAIIFVAVVMAIGGVLGVMNTMFAAISQRTKDIGVLRLLGYTRGHVLTSFLLESLLIALVGGLLGCAVGYLAANGRTASSIVSSGAGGGGKSIVLQMVVDANTLALGMVFTLFMGGVGGLIPSLSAMRLKPLESLR
jgi:ABC-type antimicrobial peptide transport system permease subunit